MNGENLAQSTKLMAPKMKFTTVADYAVIPRTRYQPDLVNYNELPRGRAREVSGFRPADDQHFRCWTPTRYNRDGNLSDSEGRGMKPQLI